MTVRHRFGPSRRMFPPDARRQRLQNVPTSERDVRPCPIPRLGSLAFGSEERAGERRPTPSVGHKTPFPPLAPVQTRQSLSSQEATEVTESSSMNLRRNLCRSLCRPARFMISIDPHGLYRTHRRARGSRSQFVPMNLIGNFTANFSASFVKQENNALALEPIRAAESVLPKPEQFRTTK